MTSRETLQNQSQLNEVLFRKPSENDAEQIAMVLSQNYNMKDLREAKEFFLKDISEGVNYVVAEQNGKIIGLATWKMHDLPKHELAEMHKIAVLDGFKGKGLAQKIFAWLVKDAKLFYKKHGKKLRKLYLMAHANNGRAIGFYEKLGFKKEAILPSHYYNGIDELVLAMYF